MSAARVPTIDVYRVGVGHDFHRLSMAWRFGDWASVRYCLRETAADLLRPSCWCVWQAEWDGCQRAPRGLTARRARRKALRQVYARAIYSVPGEEVSG